MQLPLITTIIIISILSELSISEKIVENGEN